MRKSEREITDFADIIGVIENVRLSGSGSMMEFIRMLCRFPSAMKPTADKSRFIFTVRKREKRYLCYRVIRMYVWRRIVSSRLPTPDTVRLVNMRVLSDSAKRKNALLTRV